VLAAGGRAKSAHEHCVPVCRETVGRPLDLVVRRMRQVVLALSVLSITAPPALAGQPASVEMEEAFAKYGPGVFSAVTRMEVCGFFRVMVVYWAGTDMLFVDEIQPSQGESTMSVKRGFSIREFNYYEDSNSITELSCRTPSFAILRITGKVESGHTNMTYSFRIDMDTSTGNYKYSDTQRKEN
jgi:hypothetical protein